MELPKSFKKTTSGKAHPNQPSKDRGIQNIPTQFELQIKGPAVPTYRRRSDAPNAPADLNHVKADGEPIAFGPVHLKGGLPLDAVEQRVDHFRRSRQTRRCGGPDVNIRLRGHEPGRPHILLNVFLSEHVVPVVMAVLTERSRQRMEKVASAATDVRPPL